MFSNDNYNLIKGFLYEKQIKELTNVETKINDVTWMSNGNVKYDVSSNSIVKYVPSPFGRSSTDPYATNARQILLTINPTITVLTFKQKNIFAFIGSKQIYHIQLLS